MTPLPRGLAATCAVLTTLSILLAAALLRSHPALQPTRQRPPLELDEPAR